MTTGQIIQELAPGLITTLELTLAIFVGVLVLASLLALARTSQNGLVRMLSLVYVEVFRGIPALAILYLVFFGLIGFSKSLALPAFWGAVVGLALSEAAYTCEVYRGALQSVGFGQWDAAASVGLSRWKSYRYVIVPQAIIPAVAPTFNMIVYVIKGTALASLIAVNELTLSANGLIVVNGEPLNTYLVLLGFYVVITIPVGYLGRLTERQVGGALGASARLQ